MNIEYITTKQLKIINLDAGDLMHIFKNTDEEFLGFGEAYFTKIKMSFIKGWKLHKKMTLNLVVPIGNVEFVFCDQTGAFLSQTIGENNYARITVPPNIWFAFRGLSAPFSLVMNIADIKHDPKEIRRENIDFIKYPWEIDK